MKNDKYIIDQIKPQESWRVFRVMAEFVDGIEQLTPLEPAVTIFGSARTKPGDKYYVMAEQFVNAGRRIGSLEQADDGLAVFPVDRSFGGLEQRIDLARLIDVLN